MDWYDKLSQYFPRTEMRNKNHMELLLKDKSRIYHKDESKDHVLMYAELSDFIFVDYIYVSKESRGKGVGKKLIEKLKLKNKTIILEVEPIDYNDSDTEKRLRFYDREGFKHAISISYIRKSLLTKDINEMEILYWSPNNDSELTILSNMKKMYEEIHQYKNKELYGETGQRSDEVLKIDKSKTKNILDF